MQQMPLRLQKQLQPVGANMYLNSVRFTCATGLLLMVRMRSTHPCQADYITATCLDSIDDVQTVQSELYNWRLVV